MSLRARLTLVATVAVAVAIAAASAVLYFAVRNELREPVDEALWARARGLAQIPPQFLEVRPGLLAGEGSLLAEPAAYVQLVDLSGEPRLAPGETVELPVDRRVLATAAGRGEAYFDDAEVAGTHLRILTVPLGGGYALQLARPLTEVDRSLDDITTLLILVALGGVGLAAGLGLVVARTALAPVRRLTQATEEVTATRDLTRRMRVEGGDELGRLATSFNTMLAALDESARAQRRFVADASHELRTPLTSLRTNIEVLARADSMPEAERERLLADVVDQLGEMSDLVAELVTLDRAEEGAEVDEVRLDLLVGEAIERARRQRNGVEFAAELHESVVRAARAPVERAISNLLDNAVKWSPPDGRVEVAVRGGEVVVRDHGPGIADEDLPYVFDRFYRAPSARHLPGSGLGLAIVRRVAERHGGRVSAERAEGGGTRVRLTLPLAGSRRPADLETS